MRVHGIWWMAVAALAVVSPRPSAAGGDDKKNDKTEHKAGANDKKNEKGGDKGAMKPMKGYTLMSDEFKADAMLPKRVTCDGEGKSPALRWTVAKDESPKSYALIVEDPDAPGGTFTHWVLFDIPAATKTLPSGATNIGVLGMNSDDKTGWAPACPPKGKGVHRYVFRLHALDIDKLDAKPGASRSDVEKAMENHVIGMAELTGKYQRR